MGIAFRPALEFTAGAGKGLGFDDNNNVGFTLAASLGARLFGWEDKVDLRFGVGIAAIPIGNAGGMPGSDQQSRSAFLVSPGVGFFNGLFGASLILLFDPAGKDAHGKGFALSVDVVAIKNVVDHK